MSIQVDNAELMSLLESSDVHTSSQVRELIQEQLNTGREAWLVNAVVDAFAESHSVRCLEILAGVNEPHDKHLFDRLSDHWKTGNRVQTLMIIGHLVRREPLWLSKIVNHPLMSSIVKGLKSEGDCVTLLTGALAIASLLPVIPMTVVPLLSDVFEIFNRIVVHAYNKSGIVSENCLLQIRVSAHMMFHRLYGMYPCHFLTFLRSVYGRTENLKIFKDVILPMLSRVRVHPLLVTATKEKELMRDRWKDKGVYDVLVECAELSLDMSESSGGNNASDTSPQLSHVERWRRHSGKTLTVEMQPCDAADSTAVGWTPSQTCGLSTPPPHLIGVTAVSLSLSTASTVTATVSSATWSRDSKPAPLILSSGTVSEETKSASVVSSSTGGPEDSSMPSTPLTDQVTSRRPPTTFEFSRATSSSCEDSNLDLSGRFGDCGLQLPKLVHVSTQTSLTDIETPEVHVWAPVDRATSTEEATVMCDDSDSSSSPSTSYKTPASVAAFVKKVKRIRFNSITIAKDLPSTGRASVSRPAFSRATSCPGLLVAETEPGTPSSVSSSQHHLTISCPTASLRPTFADTGLSSPLSVDRISVATQTAMYIHSSESDDVTHLALFESLVAQTIPFAPFVQCYACLHGRQPADDTTVKPASSVVPWYMSYSPSDLLDRRLDVSCRLRAAQIDNSAAAQPLSTAAVQPQASTSVDVLHHELSLLHAELMFERQRRDVHARRGRRLLARISQLNSLADQNEAVRDQLRLQEAELHKMKDALQSAEQANSSLRSSMEQLKSDFELKTKNFVNAKEGFISTIDSLETNLQQQKTERESVDRELDLARHELFLKDRDLEMLTQKAECATQLKEQVNQLNIELLLMGELHEKYQQRLAETTNVHGTEMTNLRSGYDAAVADNNDVRCQLRSKTVESEAVKAKLADVERQLHIRDVMIEEQKRLLEHTKMEYHNKLQTAENSYRDTRLRDQRTILDLQNELSLLRHQHHDAKGRRLLSAPSINSSVKSGDAEAAGGANVEASSSDFPSPASSAAEAVELESVTFGQDATDVLEDNSSAVGFS